MKKVQGEALQEGLSGLLEINQDTHLRAFVKAVEGENWPVAYYQSIHVGVDLAVNEPPGPDDSLLEKASDVWTDHVPGNAFEEKKKPLDLLVSHIRGIPGFDKEG